VAEILLVRKGQLGAVIDFGCAGLGDPAVDLLVPWNLFPAEAREVDRTELGVDDATWARGRGWAISTALGALPLLLGHQPAYGQAGPIHARSGARRLAVGNADPPGVCLAVALSDCLSTVVLTNSPKLCLRMCLWRAIG
jgi:aminoglycoside phosphotransferase (APT) family kinase protein